MLRNFRFSYANTLDYAIAPIAGRLGPELRNKLPLLLRVQ